MSVHEICSSCHVCYSDGKLLIASVLHACLLVIHAVHAVVTSCQSCHACTALRAFHPLHCTRYCCWVYVSLKCCLGVQVNNAGEDYVMQCGHVAETSPHFARHYACSSAQSICCCCSRHASASAHTAACPVPQCKLQMHHLLRSAFQMSW